MPAADLSRGGVIPFYERLNRIHEAADFDAFVERLCVRFSRRSSSGSLRVGAGAVGGDEAGLGNDAEYRRNDARGEHRCGASCAGTRASDEYTAFLTRQFIGTRIGH